MVTRGIVKEAETDGAFSFDGLPAADYVLCAVPLADDSTEWISGYTVPRN